MKFAIKSTFEKLKELFNEKKIDEISRETKFVQRQPRKMSALSFLELIVFDKVNTCTKSLESLCTHLFKDKGINISPQSLNERFNDKSVAFLKNIFEEIVLRLAKSKSPIDTKFTSRFNRILITDSSTAELSANCKDTYKGYGGDASESSVKVQVSYDIKTGIIMLPTVEDVKVNDLGHLPTFEKIIEKGDLSIKDLGYFSITHFNEVSNKSAYYLSRLKTSTVVYIKNPTPTTSKKGKIIKKSEYLILNLANGAKLLKDNEIKEFEVYIGVLKVKTRLIMCKLPKEAIEKKLIKQAKVARKSQVATSEISKLLSTVNIYITNVTADILPKEVVYLIYSIRWQIEILFKVLKSIFSFDETKDVKLERVQCHIYGTLIQLLLSSAIVFGIRNSMYLSGAKEISEYKSFGIVYSFFVDIKHALFYSMSKLDDVIEKIITSISNNGMKSKKKNKKTVLEILAF